MFERGKWIMIVDDDSAFLEVLSLEFAERGYNVCAFENLQEAKNELEVQHFDFAILDLRVCNSLGTVLIEPLIKKNSKIRIVVLTGYPSVTSAVQAIKKGAVNYLLKPIRVELLEQALWIDSVGNDFNFATSDEAFPTLADYEQEFLEFTLSVCEGNITKAAARLGLHRQSLQRKLKKYPNWRGG